MGASHRGALEADGTHEHGTLTSAYSRGLEFGRAASHPPDPTVAGMGGIASDKQHNLNLDGHLGSQIANHPDGHFSLNTAATSQHSQHANYEHTVPAATGMTVNSVTLEPVESRESGVPTSTLYKVRAARLYDQPELLVKAAPDAKTRILSNLTRGYSASELAVAAVGAYAAYSVVA